MKNQKNPAISWGYTSRKSSHKLGFTNQFFINKRFAGKLVNL
jgi:hypothetical protein